MSQQPPRPLQQTQPLPLWPQPPPPIQRRSSKGFLIFLLILLVLVLFAGVAFAVYAPSFDDLLVSLQPHCYVGVTGTAASITVRGWTANSDCDQIVTGSDTSLIHSHTLNFYRLTEPPQQPVICEIDYSGRHLIIRDEGMLKLVGNSLCAYFLQSSTGSQTSTPTTTSHYRSVSKETVAHFLSDSSSSSDHLGYLQLVNDSNLYLIYESDFTPTLNSNSFGDGDVISFIYRTDSPTTIDVSATNTSTHLVGDAYTIVQITVFGSNGQNSQVYTSSQYTH